MIDIKEKNGCCGCNACVQRCPKSCITMREDNEGFLYPVGKNSFLLSEPLDKNIFLRGFLTDLYLRPSCHACPSKSFKSGSDITIGDFRGVQYVIPEIDDDKGVSEVFVHGEKLDLSCLEKIKMESYNQYSVEKSSEKKIGRRFFFWSYRKHDMWRNTYFLVSIYQFKYDIRQLIVKVLKK